MNVSLDIDKHLIGVPVITELTVPALEAPLIARAELQVPPADRLREYEDTTLCKQIFDVTKAHSEPMISPDGIADDLWRRTVAEVARLRGFMG